MRSGSETRPWPTAVRRRSVPGSFGCAAVALLLGLIIGVGVSVLYASISQSDRQPLTITPSAGHNAIHIQLSSVFITQLVKKNIGSAGLPGQISNVQVGLTHNAPMTISGDDQFNVLGITITRHFIVTLQPLVQSCRPHVRVLHADMGGIPVTGFVTSFEAQINQQLQFNTNDLPQGFTYCATSVQTETNALSVDFTATPGT